MSRLLLTGANGFVGTVLSSYLRRAGFHVTAVSGHQASMQSSPADQQLTCDINQPEAVAEVVAKAAPTHVVHLAAITHVPTSFASPLSTWQTNVMGSLHLLEAVRRHAPQAFILFASSSEVYGAAFGCGKPVDERTPCEPLNPYAASKLAAESAFREYFRQGLAGVIARPFNHIGAQQTPNFVTASFARQIALIEAGRQPPVLKVGNLDAHRDFLDVRDVCSAYLSILALAGQPGPPRCLNIASGRPRRIREVLDALLALSSADIRVELDPERLRPSDIPLAAGDSRLLRQATGWQPVISLEQTLRELLEHWRRQVRNG